MDSVNDQRQGRVRALLGRDLRSVGRTLRRAGRSLNTLIAPLRQDAGFVLLQLLRALFTRILATIAWFDPVVRLMWSSAGEVLQLIGRGVWRGLGQVWEATGDGRAWLHQTFAPLIAVTLALVEPLLEPLLARIRPRIQPWIEHKRLQYDFNWRPRVDRARLAFQEWRTQARLEVLAWPAHEKNRLVAWARTGRWQTEGLIALLLLIGAFWVTAPAWVLGPREYLIGGGENPDWTGTAWAYWWTGYALSNGLNPFDGNWSFFPVGQRPVGQYNLLDGVLGAPMMSFFGPTLGYNVFALFTVWTSALAMYVLARSAGASRPAAVLAGIGLVSSSFFGFELRDGRLSQTLLVFWILGFAGLERLARGLGTWRLAVATGVLVAITHLIYWYNGLFLILAATPVWAYEMRRWDLARFRRLGLAAGVTILLCSPYIVSLAQHFKYLPGTQRALEEWMNYGELGRGEFGLNSAIRHSHWPGWPLIHPFFEPDDHRVAIAVLVLGFGGLLLKGPARGRWLAVLVTGYVLTLGPYLKGYDGDPTELKLPYLLLYDHFPFFNRLWWPGRMALIFMVPLLVLAALHLDRLSQLWRRGRNLVLVLGCFSVFADVDLRNAFVPIMGRAPEAYNRALYESLDGPIITTPVLGQDPAGRHHLWFQVYHELPILYGLGAHISSHRPVGYEAYINANGLLETLATVSENESEVGIVTPEDVDKLISDGFRWAVIDPTCYTFDYAQNYYYNFYQVFYKLWGTPDVVSGYGLAWRVEPIEDTVTIPALQPAGPSEFGKAPVLPGTK